MIFSHKDTNKKIRTLSLKHCGLWHDFGSSAFLRLSQPFTCVYAAGTKFGSNQTSTDVYELGLSYLSISVFIFAGMIIAETGRRICATRSQQIAKPGRQLITFLLFANITLWILDTFMTHNWVTQEIQLGFYGLLAWGVISRISLPLMIFYRFHSCVVLGMVSHKMSLITIFGHKYFRQKFL